MFVAIIIATMSVALRGVRCQPTIPEWHRLDDGLYLVDSVSKVTYDEAQSLCEGYGANLARVDSDKIQAFLTTFITPPLKDTRCFWIGSNDREVEGQFMWLDGTPVIYDGWAPSQPDDHGRNQDCACLWSSRRADRHGQWDDDCCTIQRNLICQKGVYDFHFTILRSNPGFASLSCAVDVLIDGETLSPNDVTLSVGQTLSSSKPIPYWSTRLSGEFRNNSFIVGNMNDNDDDEVFCYVGQLPSQARSFSLASVLPVFDFYNLPVLTLDPVVTSISASSVTVSWNSWIPCLDSGDGPVIGYFIYRQMMGEEWVQVGGVNLTKVGAQFQRRIEFALAGLEADTEYSISVSAVREGPGGEGPRGPHVTFTTSNPDNDHLKDTRRVWISLFWISLLGNVLLAVALVFVWKRREKEDLSRLRASPPTGDAKSPDHYEIPQPSVVRNQAYQDLKVGAKSDKEAVYADIDEPAKLDYVNISSDVQKSK